MKYGLQASEGQKARDRAGISYMTPVCPSHSAAASEAYKSSYSRSQVLFLVAPKAFLRGQKNALTINESMRCASL